MNLSAQFKEYLLSQSNPPSKITVKNYLSDINKFIRWIEAKLGIDFDPSEINQTLLDKYKEESLANYSASSVDRSLSSLRKFFYFLKLEGKISHTPFELSSIKSEAPDPWKIKDFKNHLYVFNASHLTIKNYIIDVKQFVTWVDTVVKSDSEWEINKLNNFSKINFGLIEEYKARLLNEALLSPISVNRKLSSIRRFITWANQEGLIKDAAKVVNLPSDNFGFKVNPSIPVTSVMATENLARDNSKDYSSFPPLRLYQKSVEGAVAAFDNTVTSPIADALEKSDEIVWNLKGRPVFKDRLKEKLKIPSFKIIDPKKINNVPKSFYAPAQISTANFPLHKKVLHHARHSRPKWYKTYHSYTFVSYLHFSILMLFISAMGYLVFNDFNTKQQPPTFAALPSSPPRILSFQGRLTDANDNPITKGTTLRMSIYNNQTSSGSALLWQEVVSPTPDDEGIFSILLGNNNPIPQSLFAQNSGLWLGVTVENTSELKPRQQIATVAFASNAETLQGLPPITNSSSTSNVVLALNSSGNLTIGGTANPIFQATGGTFTVSGRTLVLTTSNNGDIRLSPNGTGIIDIQKSVQNTSNSGLNIPGSVTIEDLFSVVATSSGHAVINLSQGSTGDLIIASTSGNTRFRVDNAGNITANGSVNGLAINSGTIISGTWNATAIGAPYGGTGQTSYATGDMLYASDSTVISKLAIGTNGTCLTSDGTTPSWVSCITASGGSGYWNQSAGVLFPNNSTVDLLVGGQSTESAKFAILNVNGSRGSQTASISGGITLDSSSANIQTTNNQSLVLGGSSTGLVQVKNNINNIFATFDTVNSRVGIGTSTPEYQLDLVNSGDAAIRLKDTSNNLEGFITTGGSTVDFGSFTNHPVVFYTNNNNKLRISANGGLSLGTTYSTTDANANELIVEGNVGIGTTSPTAKLDVGGNASISGGLTFYATPTIQSSNLQTLTFGGNTTGNINLEPSSTTNSGLVLIGSAGLGGVSNPDFLVVDQASGALPTPVNGAIAMDSTGKFNIYESGAWKVLCNKTDAACGAGSGAALSAITAATGGNTINSGDNAQVWNWSVSSPSKTAFTFGENSASTGNAAVLLKIATIANSTAFPFQVEAQGSTSLSISSNGLVGMGTTSPLATLDLRTKSGTLPIASISGQTSNSALIVDNSFASGDIFTASKSGKTHFVIDRNGNVGIGTTNPSAILEVLRDQNDGTFAQVTNNNSGANAYSEFTASNGTGYAEFGIGGTGYTQYNSIIQNRAYVWSNSFTDGISVVASKADTDIRFYAGGTNLSNERLRLGGSSTLPSASISGSTSFAGLVVDNSFASGDIFTASKSGATKFVIDRQGNVGIGNNTPEGILHLGSLNNADNQTVYFDSSSQNQNSFRLVFRDEIDSGFQMVHDADDGEFHFRGWNTGSLIDILQLSRANGDVYVQSGILGVLTDTADSFFNGSLAIGASDAPSQLYVTRPLSSGANGTALAIFDQIEDQDIFTASKSGVTRFTVDANGKVVLPTQGSTGGLLIGGDGTLYRSDANELKTDNDLIVAGDFSATTSLNSDGNTRLGDTNTDTLQIYAGSSGSGISLMDSSFANCGLLSTVSNLLTCSSLPGGSTNYWQLNTNLLSPINSTYDFAIGGTASTAAKFAFLNVANGTPTASISGNSGNIATYLTGDGTLGTTNRQTLTIGGSTTGNIILSPLNSGSGAQILPGADNLVSLGATMSARYKDLFLGPASLHIQCTTGNGCGQNLDYSLGVNTSSNAFYLGANGRSGALNQLLTVTEGGNVGINVAAPQAALHIGSTDQLKDFIRFEGGASGDSSIQQFYSETSWANNSYGRNVGGSGYAYDVAGAASRISQTAGTISLQTAAAGAAGGNITWGTKLYVDNAGKIGINTTSPITTLDVRGASAVIPAASISGSMTNATLVIDQSGTGNIFTASKSGATKFTLGNSGNINAISTTTGASDWVFTNPTEYSEMYISAPGTGKGAYLQLNGNQTSDNSVGNIGFRNNDDSIAYITGFRDGANDAGGIGFETQITGISGTNNRMWIDSNGAIGMGTTTPASQLFVTRPVSNVYPALGKALVSFNQIENQDIFTASASGTTRFVIQNDGDIGIGTGSPRSQVEILKAAAGTVGPILTLTNNGNAANDAGYINFYSGGAGSETERARLTFNIKSGGYGQLLWGNDNAGSINTKFIIDSGGEIGILTTSPTSQLHVTRPLNFGAKGKALAIFDQIENQDILTASASGSTMFRLSNAGDIIGAGVLQAGSGTTAVAYNRIGAGTATGSDISVGADLLVSDSLEVADQLYIGGNVWFTGVASNTNDRASLCINNGGTGAVTVDDAGNNCDTSSLRYKHNIEDLDYGLDEIMQLRPVSFIYNDDPTSNNTRTERRLGFIAEEMDTVLPEFTTYLQDGTVNGVDYVHMVALAIKGIQQQQIQIDNLKTNLANISALEGIDINNVGEITIAPTIDDNFEVKRQSGETVNRIGAFSEILAAKIKSGYFETGKLIVTGSASVKNLTTDTLTSTFGNFSQLSTDSIAIGSENITIAGQGIREYITSIVEEVVGENDNTIIVAPILSTDVITPKNGKNLAVKLKSDDSTSRLEIQNLSGSTVASIDALGNASLSGELKSNSINTNDASISGTLRATKIIADQIEGLSIQASSVSANYITNNYYAATPSASTFQSTGSASFDNLVAMRATFEQGLMAYGPASFYEASIADRLFVGSRLSLADTSINVLGGNLELQPLRQGGVSLVGGLVEIDVDGNLKVNGNAYFAKDVDIKGKLLASFVSPLPGRDFVLELGRRDQEGESENHDSSFVIRNSSASALLSVNNKGDLSASGAGTFNKLNLNIVNKALALSPTEVIATGSAGTAEIQPNREELTVRNELVTEDSLIYITTKTSTQSESVYLLRQVPGKSFTVGISSPINKKVPFNWIIIN